MQLFFCAFVDLEYCSNETWEQQIRMSGTVDRKNWQRPYPTCLTCVIQGDFDMYLIFFCNPTREGVLVYI